MDDKRLDELLAATEGHSAANADGLWQVWAENEHNSDTCHFRVNITHEADGWNDRCGDEASQADHDLINAAPAFRAAVIALREENRRAQLLTEASIKAIAPDSPYQHNGAVWVCGGCVTVGQLEDAVRSAKGAKDA